MIFTKKKPYTVEEIVGLKEHFEVYIKAVVDIEKQICSAGCDRHFESEKLLLDQGSKQENLWGGGIDLETKIIDCISFINIRPNQQNTSNEILDEKTRVKFTELMEYFFNQIYG